MFTGVIHHIGKIVTCEKQGDWRITVESDLPVGELNVGDSIACNGCCLTVIACHPAGWRDQESLKSPTPQQVRGDITFSLSPETLRCTAPRWDAGTKLHLERAMKLGDTLDGHMVSGHVDGLATLISISPEKDSHKLELEAPAETAKFIAEKGSVTLDGISLTVNEVNDNRFTVNIIPHTWQATNFHTHKVGDTLNLEIDLIARYVGRLLGK